jgi:hypothetical protein
MPAPTREAYGLRRVNKTGYRGVDGAERSWRDPAIVLIYMSNSRHYEEH